MGAIEVPAEYGYTLLSAVSTYVVGIWLGGRVVAFRKAAKIPYPYEYASYEQIQTASPASQKAMMTFNYAQRGHQNFLENHASTVGALLIAGLAHPKAAAATCAFWSVNRVLYAVGYTNWNDNGKGRYAGLMGMLVQYAAPIWAGVVAWGIATK